MRLFVLLKPRWQRLSESAFRRLDDLRKIEEILSAQSEAGVPNLQTHMSMRTHAASDARLI